MDIFSELWERYSSAAKAVPDPIYFFLLNAFAGLSLPAALGFFGFVRGWRSPVYQRIVVILGVLVALSLPLEALLAAGWLRVWLLPFLLLGTIYLPHVWAFLAEPRRTRQKEIRRRIQLTLCGLFVLNLIWMCVL